MTSETPQKIVRTRLEIVRERAERSAALLQQLEAKEKAKAAQMSRQLDTRRKVLLGVYLLDKIEREPEAKIAVLTGLDRFLTRPAERALFDLAPLTDSAPSPQERKPGLPPTPSA